jgi:hypothetical protein
MYARSGLTESAAMFFLVSTFALLQQDLTFCRGLTLGAIAAISWLDRPIALAWVFGAMLVLLAYGRVSRSRRFVAVGSIAGGVLAVLLLSEFTLGWSGGKAIFALNLAYGVGDPQEALTAPFQFVIGNFDKFAGKIIWQISRPLVYMFRFGDIPILSGIAPFGLLLCLNEDQRFGRALLTAMLVSNALFLCVLMSGDAFVGPLRYFDVFAPLALPWAIQFLLRLREQLSDRLKVAFWCLLTVAMLGSAYQSIRNPSPLVPHPEIYTAIRAAVANDEVIAASGGALPPFIAWHADRRTVMLEPDQPQALSGLRRKGLQISWFLTKQDEPRPAGFEVTERWETGLILWRNVAGAIN